MWHAADGMGWWMLWGGLMMVLFWGVIIGFVVWAVQAATRRQDDGRANAASLRRPIDMAKQRYAQGEISKAEFEQLREDLEDRSPSGPRSRAAEVNTTAESTTR